MASVYSQRRPVMKPILMMILAAGVLSACSERKSCMYEAGRELRTISALTAETRLNVSRGYAISETEVPYTVQKTCTTTLSDAPEFRVPCPEIRYRTERKPVAIDLNAERAKLRSLEERLAQLKRQHADAIAQCEARYPE